MKRNVKFVVRLVTPVIMIAALAACRGESTPRDFQNAPPAMTHPPQKKKETPAANGMGKVAPEPNTGVEGDAAPYKTVTPTQQPQTTTMKDTAPTTPPAASTTS